MIASAPMDSQISTQRTRILEVTLYETYSAFLISSIAVVGVWVMLGVMAWAMQFEWQVPFKPDTKTGVPILEQPAEDSADQVSPLETVEESALEDSQQLDLPQTLLAMTTAVSTNAASLDALGKKTNPQDGRGIRGGGIGGGPGEPQVDEVPEPQRWRVTFEASRRSEYNRQLDYFGIELGAVSKTTARIDLFSDLADETPTRDVTTRGDEKRLYFSHTSRRLKRWDNATAKAAGLDDPEERIMVQFYGDAAREKLQQTEAAFLEGEGKSLEDVSRTFFKVRELEGAFEFYVDRIEYKLNKQ